MQLDLYELDFKHELKFQAMKETVLAQGTGASLE